MIKCTICERRGNRKDSMRRACGREAERTLAFISGYCRFETIPDDEALAARQNRAGETT